MKGTSSVGLKVILLIAVVISGCTSEKMHVREDVGGAVYHAFFHMCLTYVSILVLLFAFLGCSGYMPKSSNLWYRVPMMMCLIHSSLAWQIPPSSSQVPRVPTDKTEIVHSSLKCDKGTSGICKVELKLDGRFPLVGGHFAKFKVIDDNSKVHVGRLTVENATTIVPYSADVVMPYYNLVHKMMFKSVDTDDFKVWDGTVDTVNPIWEKMSTHNGTSVGLVNAPKGQIIPWEASDRQLLAIGDRWKCGAVFKSSDTIRQVYAMMPSPWGGWIQWVPNGDVVQSITVCLDLIVKTCITAEFTANEEIHMTNDHFDLTIRRPASPDIPEPINLLSRYTVNQKATEVSLSDWKIMSRSLRGSMRKNDLGALQSSCVYTKSRRCTMAHVAFSEYRSWALTDKSICSQPMKGVGVALLTFAALVGVATAIVGGMKVGASCRACQVEYEASMYPDYQDGMANNYAPINDYIEGKVKTLPVAAALVAKGYESYASNIQLKISDYDRALVSYMLRTADGLEVERVTDGTVRSMVVDSCNVNLAGGVGTCHITIDSEGDISDLEVNSGDDVTIVLNRVISVQNGKRAVEIGIEGEHSRADVPVICLGSGDSAKCAPALMVTFSVEPDISTIDTFKDRDGGQIKDVSFKELWDILSNWWERLVLIALIICSVFLGVVVIIMGTRLLRCILMLSGLKKIETVVVKMGQYRNTTGHIHEVHLWYIENSTEVVKALAEKKMPNETSYFVAAGYNRAGYFGEGSESSLFAGFHPATGTPYMHDKSIPLDNINSFELENKIPIGIVKGTLDQIRIDGWIHGVKMPSVRIRSRSPMISTYGQKVPLYRSLPALNEIAAKSPAGGFFSSAEPKGCKSDLSSVDPVASKDGCDPIFVPIPMSAESCHAVPEEYNLQRKRWNSDTGKYETPDAEKGKKQRKSWGKPVRQQTWDGGHAMDGMICDSQPYIGHVDWAEVCGGVECTPYESNDAKVACLSSFIMKDDMYVMVAQSTGGNVKTTEWKWKDLIQYNDDTPFFQCGLRTRGIGEHPEDFLERLLGAKWWSKVTVVDVSDQAGLKWRQYMAGPLLITSEDRLPEKEHIKRSIPITTHPTGPSRGGILMAAFIHPERSEIMMPSEEILNAKLALGYVSGEVSWEVRTEGMTTLVIGKCTSCTVTVKDKPAKVSKFGELKDDGCVMDNGRVLEAQMGGPERADCMCVKDLAFCAKDTHIAIFKADCQEEKYENYKIKIFRGNYRCGTKEITLEHNNGEVLVRGAGWFTNDSWATKVMYYPGDRMDMRGQIETWDDGIIHTYSLNQASGSDCDNNFKCAWDKQHVLCVLFISLPASFLLLFIVMALAKCLIKTWTTAKKASVAKTAGRVADRIVGNPDKTIIRREFIRRAA